MHRQDSHDFILYVDEAGDDGLRSLKPENPAGSSEWLCLAGYLIRASVEHEMAKRLADMRATLRLQSSAVLHYRNLNPTQRLLACQTLAKDKARAFVVCSYKRTMLNHDNPRAAAVSGGPSQYLYNFLARFLLERATDFVLRLSEEEKLDRPGVLKVIFSRRRGHRFGQMKAYIELLKRQATGKSTWIKAREIRGEVLRYNQFDSVPHEQLAGLQFADLVASAFFQALDTHTEAWSLTPAISLSGLLAREVVGPRRLVADYGVTLVPQPHLANLSRKQEELFRAYGYIFGDRYRMR